MPRPLPQILAHIRAVAGNPSINTTLIQTEDLLALCDEVDEAERLRAIIAWLDDNEPTLMSMVRERLTIEQHETRLK
jgi:hypothetical protein